MSEADATSVTNRRRTFDRIVIALLVIALIAQTINMFVQQYGSVVLLGWNVALFLIGRSLYTAGKRSAAAIR